MNTIAIETIQSYTLTNTLFSSSTSSNINILTTPTYAALPEYKYITIYIRHTMLALPNFNLNSYRRRRYHPKSGLNSISYDDEYINIFKPRDQHYIVRHHLYITDSSSSTTTAATTTTTTTPNSDTATSNTSTRATITDNTASNTSNSAKYRRLVYYIDPHTPPEYHQCMIDGVSLWYVRDASILIT